MSMELMACCFLVLLSALWAGYEIGKSDLNNYYYQQWRVASQQLAIAMETISRLRAEVKR